jgi:hypothetical protein
VLTVIVVAAEAGLALPAPKATASASNATKANRQTCGLPTGTPLMLESLDLNDRKPISSSFEKKSLWRRSSPRPLTAH